VTEADARAAFELIREHHEAITQEPPATPVLRVELQEDQVCRAWMQMTVPKP
jgi:hypothetical protein